MLHYLVAQGITFGSYVRFFLYFSLFTYIRFLLRYLPTPKSDVLYGRCLKQLNFAPHFSCVCNLMSFFFLFSFFFHFKDVEIALVGKYTKLEDAYASVIKALNHASLALNHRLRQEKSSRGVAFRRLIIKFVLHT